MFRQAETAANEHNLYKCWLVKQKLTRSLASWQKMATPLFWPWPPQLRIDSQSLCARMTLSLPEHCFSACHCLFLLLWCWCHPSSSASRWQIVPLVFFMSTGLHWTPIIPYLWLIDDWLINWEQPLPCGLSSMCCHRFPVSQKEKWREKLWSHLASPLPVLPWSTLRCFVGSSGREPKEGGVQSFLLYFWFKCRMEGLKLEQDWTSEDFS